MLNEYDQIRKTLLDFSPEWITQYFDLLKQLLIRLQIGPDDERIALTATSNNDFNFNIGNRWMLQPMSDGVIGITVSLDFPVDKVKGEVIGKPFSYKREPDAYWIRVAFPSGVALSSSLINNWENECMRMLTRVKRSPQRKHHSRILYDMIMDGDIRQEVFKSDY